LPNPNSKVYEIRVPKNLKYDYSSYILDLTGEDVNEFPDTAKIAVKPDSHPDSSAEKIFIIQ